MNFLPNRCLVIAEAGVNHNGSLEMACQLATAAKEAGADYVKFQTFVPSLVASYSAPVATYQLQAGYRSQQAMLSDFVLSDDEHQSLKNHCEVIGIGFSSTGHDLESAEYLNELGQDFVKVGSGDLTNLQLLETVAAFGKTLLISTGASSMEDVVEVVKFLEGLNFPCRESLILLQCTSAYPAPSFEANVRVLTRYKAEFGCHVGFSDHTATFEAALAAVSLGAVVIEKHITLDTMLPGPDQTSSLDPAGFRAFVSSIRCLEEALGSDEKQVTKSEADNQRLIRKGLYARTAIPAGAKFSSQNVIAKRPDSDVPASIWPTIKGKRATRSYDPDDPLEVGE